MKLKITVKQESQKIITLDKVKSHYFDKYSLSVTMEDGKYRRFKTSTVLEIEEL